MLIDRNELKGQTKLGGLSDNSSPLYITKLSQEKPTHQHCRDNHILPPLEPAAKVLVEQDKEVKLYLGFGNLGFDQLGKK